MTAPDQFTWLARIRRTQGRKGELFCEILTDFPEKFAERKRLWLLGDTARHGSMPGRQVPPREVQLTEYWLHKGGVVLHFAGIESISLAEELVGLVVAIPRAERATLGEEEAYITDLMGCVLVDVAGPEPVTVGEIEDVDRSGPVPMLVVRAPRPQPLADARRMGQPDEVLVPFAKEYLRRLDTDDRRVEMALPEGLRDLNAHE